METKKNEWGATDPAFGLKPLPGFTGEAVVLVLDKPTGGYATKSVEIPILQLTIDGCALPVGSAELDEIRAVGQVRHLQLRDVQVRKVTGQGINTTRHSSAIPQGSSPPGRALRPPDGPTGPPSHRPGLLHLRDPSSAPARE